MATKKKTTKSKTQKGTRRSSLKRKGKANRFARILRWGRRIAVVCVVLIALSWAGVWFFLSEADSASANWVRSTMLSVSVDAGFRINDILVEGREYSDPDALLALLNVKKGDPIFSLVPKEAKAQIEKIGWVKSARVERRLPDTVYVKLVERKPLALWQNKGKLSLIDSQGALLTQENLKQFKDLLMIRGKNSPARAEKFIALLEAEPNLKSRVDRADLIDARRWDLFLSDGKRIKLPESDVGLAMRNIMLRHEQDNILGKDSITVIDARYVGRLIIRTKLGKVQDYKAGIIGDGAHL